MIFMTIYFTNSKKKNINSKGLKFGFFVLKIKKKYKGNLYI